MKPNLNTYSQVMIPTYAPADICFIRGEGCYLYDANDDKYLDFIAGISVNCLGYGHPRLVETISRQAKKLMHISNLFMNKPQIKLARKLASLYGEGKIFFCNSGAEANEAAIKLARKYARQQAAGTDRYEIITMKKSFHGRTMATITATGQDKYQEGLDPLLPGFRYAEFGNLDSLKGSITPKTCAIMLEPIQAEGGINQASPEYWTELQKLCKEKNILLILDEVQTGMGRTGTFFAYEQLDIKPDILSLAKGLGGGFPIGAIIASDEVCQSFKPGDHASTFGGNPLGTATALTVIQTILDDNILDNVKARHKQIEDFSKRLLKIKKAVVEVRGKGLLWGIELKDGINCLDIIQKAKKQHLLLNCIGGRVIRIAPPLILSEKQCARGLETIESILKDL